MFVLAPPSLLLLRRVSAMPVASSARCVLQRPLLLLWRLLVVAAVMSLSVCVSALPVGRSVVSLAGILPFTSTRHAGQAARVRAVMDLMTADVNSGVAVAGRPAHHLGAGVTLQIVYADSGDSSVGAMRALFDLYGSHNATLAGIIGELTDDITTPLDFLASDFGLPLTTPLSAAASLGSLEDHPYFWRPAPDDVDNALAMLNLVKEADWKRAALFVSDDDSGIGFSDVFLREVVNTNAAIDAQAEAENAAGVEVTAALLLAREHHEVTPYTVPWVSSTTTTDAISQALDHLYYQTDTRIFLMYAPDAIAVEVIELAYARGMVGTGPDGVVRQWAGTFCTADVAAAFQTRPHMLEGVVCDLPSGPRTDTERSDGVVDDHSAASQGAVDFETRLKASKPDLWPADSHIDSLDINAASSVLGMVALLGDMYASTRSNDASSFMAGLPATFTRVDGQALTVNADGTAQLIDIERRNWQVSEKKFVTTSYWNMADVATQGLSVARQATLDPLVLATGSLLFTKDRAHVYVTGDPLPALFDGKFVVLAFVISVLGGWTALILLEQALSFWSRGVWVQACGWVLLASIAFGLCAVWPDTLMLLCSLTLDVDAVLNLKIWSVAVGAVYPIFLSLAAFLLCIHGVDGGLKPAANVNVDRVSDVTDVSSTAGSHSGASGSAQSGASHTFVSRTRFKAARNRLTRQVDKFRESVVTIVRQSGLQLVAASAIMAILFVSHVLILTAGFYLKASMTVPATAYVGSWFLSFFINLVSLTMYFHTTRSGWRYAAPFLLCAGLLGSFFVIVDAAVWTYVAETNITSTVLRDEQTVAADTSLALTVALVSAGVCVLLMIFNVHRLRLSRNVLDKVLSQVAGQVRSLEGDIEGEKEVRAALIEQADFFRRSLELINLCRPVWRPYAVALALADPEELDAADLAAEKLATAALGPLEKERKQLAPAGTKQQKSGDKVHKEKSAAAGATSGKIDEEKSGASNKAGSKQKSESKEAAVLTKGKDKDMLVPKAKSPDPAKEEGKEAVELSGTVLSGGGAAQAGTGHEGSALRPSKLPGVAATPEQPKRKVTVAPPVSATGASSVEEKERVVSGGGSAGSGGAGSDGGSSGSNKVATAVAHGSTLSDFQRVHAPKKEKQLLALLKEIGDLRLDSAPSSRVVADVKLPQILSHPVTLELMKDVLAKNLSPENIALWIDIQRYRSLENASVRKAVADEICQTFIVSGAKFEVNLSSFMRDYVRTQVNKGVHALDLFDEVEREIYRLMVTNNTEPLVQSNMFKLAALVLQHPAYKLKSASLVNNVRGEVGGNVASTIGSQALLAPAAAVQQQAAMGGNSQGLSAGIAQGRGNSMGVGTPTGSRGIPGGGGVGRALAPSPTNAAPATRPSAMMWPANSGGAGAARAQGSNSGTPRGSPNASPVPFDRE